MGCTRDFVNAILLLAELVELERKLSGSDEAAM